LSICVIIEIKRAKCILNLKEKIMCNNVYSKKLKYITDKAEELSRLKGVTEFIRIGPITVCKIESDEKISMGVAICGADDVFTKSAGRYWSSHRAFHAHLGRSLAKSKVSPQGLEVLVGYGIKVASMVSAFVFRGDGKDKFSEFICKLTEQYKKRPEITLTSCGDLIYTGLIDTNLLGSL